VIDLHCHLLPDWDDGAVDRAEALRMLAVARSDGIKKIGMTPHVHRMTRPGLDVADLRSKMGSFLDGLPTRGIDIFPGAEVSYHRDMLATIKDLGLTVNGSDYVFIEFPAGSLPEEARELVPRMMLSGLIPIISHPERNTVLSGSPEALYEMIRQGAIGQLTAQSLTGEFGARVRNAAERFLRLGLVHLIASDAHNSGSRAPRLSGAVKAAANCVGAARAEAMVTTVPAAILANEQVPDLGEPLDPLAKRRPFWPIRFRGTS
jgi:protein-tyrosine phosphatase